MPLDRPRHGMSKTKIAALIYLCGMVVLHGILFWHARELVGKGYSDFTIYYGAATMVRRGLGGELYNGVAQFKVQREFAPDVPIRQSALPFNHPPFEALLFVPFTYLSYVPAFISWDIVNLGILAVLPFLVRRHVPELRGYRWPLWMLTSLAFFPIFLTLLQGQDSILLLLLYTLAFVCVKKNSEALAGGFLALGLFKPHLILPFVFLWVLRSGKKILYGFLATAAALALVSVGIVGIRGVVSYPSYILHLEKTMAGGAIKPSDMPNLRGVIYVLARGSFDSGVITIVLSCATLVLAAWLCRKMETDASSLCWKLSLAIVTTAVISYHCMGYDLSILFLPLALIVGKLEQPGFRGWSRVLVFTGVALLFFSPLELLLSQGHRLGIIGWAVLLLLSGIVVQIWFQTQNGASASANRPTLATSG
jgi:glycosyl transferase family 87